MTMVPAEFSLSKQHHHNLVRHQYYSSNYGSIGCGDFSYGADVEFMKQGYEYSDSDIILVNQIPMAEDESRTNSLNEAVASTSNNNNNNQEDQEIVRDDTNWLQLSIGGAGGNVSTNNKNQDHEEEEDQTARRSPTGGLVELDLLPDTSTNTNLYSQPGTSSLIAPIFNVDHYQFRAPVTSPPPPVMFKNTSLFFQGGINSGSATTSFNPHQEINWAFRHPPLYPQIFGASSSSTSSSSSLMNMPYFGRPFQFNPAAAGSTSLLDNYSNNNIRVIDPPRRPHSGVWFILQASLNQGKEPFLAQIPKSFIRIKDGGMTVRLLIKYLVNKLHLDSESQVEIRCRGEELEPLLTLQHVRDHIWSTQRHVTLLQPSSSVTDHLMVLHYGSRRTPN